MFVPRTLTPIARSGATHILETYTAASLLSTLTTLGLTTNLKLCLDAGEGDSYTSGQSWLDLSGNGYDFFRGATSGATTDDPTFNGVADALSSAEYWSFDGGDYFRYDTTNESWMNALHKDSAAFTVLLWVYPAGAGVNRVFGTCQNNVSRTGVGLSFNSSTGVVTFNCCNGTGVVARSIVTGNIGMADGSWQMLALSLDEAGNSAFLQRNAVAQAAVAASYTSPSALAASDTMEIAALGGGVGPTQSGSRLGMLAIFDAAMTSWQIEQIYNKTRRRFGV